MPSGVESSELTSGMEAAAKVRRIEREYMLPVLCKMDPNERSDYHTRSGLESSRATASFCTCVAIRLLSKTLQAWLISCSQILQPHGPVGLLRPPVFRYYVLSSMSRLGLGDDQANRWQTPTRCRRNRRTSPLWRSMPS